MNKKTILIIIVIALLFLSVVAAGFVVMWNKLASLSPMTDEQPSEASAEIVEEKTAIGPLYPLKTFIVNLADPGGKRYLRVTMELELSTDKAIDEINKRLPQIRDAILMILPTRTIEDVQSVQGKEAIRKEIMEKINELLTAGAVINIYFTEFVVQ